MKMIMLHTSKKFNEKDRKRLSNATNLPRLHAAVVTRFDILRSLKKSNESALMKVKKLNNQIVKESLFSFSFVRHPYTRYELYILLKVFTMIFYINLFNIFSVPEIIKNIL